MAAAGIPQPPSAVMDMKQTYDQNQRTERGASAVEYGLLIVGIAGVLVLVIIALGGSISGLFSNTCNLIADEIGTTC